MRGEVASGRSYISQSDLRVHFGLGTADRVEKLEIRWAGGSVQEYPVSGIDRQMTIDQRISGNQSVKSVALLPDRRQR
jgi:hypothetical protein